MSKLFKLKEWLPLQDAAAHISTVLGEPATVADLYRLALDGHLTLSVDFVNHANAKTGKWVKAEEIEFETIEFDIFTGDKLDVPYRMPNKHELHVKEDDWIRLDDSVVSIEGIWDLTLIGAERLDIEHEYQQLTSGLEVTLTTLDGIFVQQGDIICQLQTDFDNNEYQRGSKAQQKAIEYHIATKQLEEGEAQALRDNFGAERKKYLKQREESPRESNYFPSGGLAEHDYALVIRTQEITRLIRSLEPPSAIKGKPLSSKERNSLLVLIGALCKQVDIDPTKRGVAASLVEMTEILGAPLTDDTIRKILRQIEDAVAARKI